MKSLRYAIGLLALGTACSQNDMTAPALDAPSLAISDAVHNQGNPHFFFLRPIVTSDPATAGTFDLGRSPTVTICEFSGTACVGAPIAVFTPASMR